MFGSNDFNSAQASASVFNLARQIECSRRPYEEVETGLHVHAADPLASVIQLVLKRHRPRHVTLWCSAVSARQPGSNLFDRLTHIVEAIGEGRLTRSQKNAVRQLCFSFVDTSVVKHRHSLLELSVTSFSNSGRDIATSLAHGGDQFSLATRTTPVFRSPGENIRIRTSRSTDAHRVVVAPRHWLVAKDDGLMPAKRVQFRLRDRRRVTRWFGDTVLRSFEERLDLAEEEEAALIRLPWEVYHPDDLSIRLGRTDLRIRCVRYIPMKMPGGIERVDVQRLEINLRPFDFGLQQIITRCSSLRCYAATHAGVGEMLRQSEASIRS